MRLLNMKIKSLIASVAVVMAGNAVADQSLIGTGAPVGTVPVGILTTSALYGELQASQLGADCVGDTTKACKPSISSIELLSLMKTDIASSWASYGLDVSGFAAPNIGVCGTIDGDEATKVAASRVGLGCSQSAPASAFSIVATQFGVPQADMTACMGALEASSVGAIGFAAMNDSVASSYDNVKFDGQAPELANLLAGNYTMHADVFSTDGVPAGAAPVGGTAPQHAVGINFGASDYCAPSSTQSAPSLVE